MQRQLRLGDILDDYCPRERRVTNHAVVAMVDTEVKQTRCTTCDTEHEYKQAKVPRQRRKADSASTLYSQVAAGAPRRVTQEEPEENAVADNARPEPVEEQAALGAQGGSADQIVDPDQDAIDEERDDDREESREDDDRSPAHRRLIRASLPRPEGQPPPSRPIPEFTIRQPGGRPNRFRARHQRGGNSPFHGNRSNGNMGGPFRGNAGPRPPRRHGGQGGGRKRSK